MSFSKVVKTRQKPTQETDQLIESMQKLIDHMNENPTHQEEIFKSLSNNDVIKIIQNFDDPNVTMRKTSAAFLCELVYENEKVQQGFCEITKILQSEGKVCVTRIPQSFLAHSKAIPEIFELIKNSAQPADNPLGWYYEIPLDKNYKKGLKYIKYEKASNARNVKTRIQNFIDPMNCLFGFFVKGSGIEKSVFTQKTEMRDSAVEQFQQETPLPKPKEFSGQKLKQSQVSQSPQNHLQSRKPISVLNRSVDLGTIQSTRDQKLDKSNIFNKTVADPDQFTIKEEVSTRPETAVKSSGSNYSTLRDKVQVKPRAKIASRK